MLAAAALRDLERGALTALKCANNFAAAGYEPE
jgi:hypothetical protein